MYDRFCLFLKYNCSDYALITPLSLYNYICFLWEKKNCNLWGNVDFFVNLATYSEWKIFLPNHLQKDCRLTKLASMGG
jgi:hypothetical protein